MTNADRIRRHTRQRRRRAAHLARRRRGVLLLIVLSILVMFMLLGTAFVLTGSNYGQSAKNDQKANIAKPQQADLLDRALRQVLRDTHDRNSAVRYHSLLRDAYGTDGFVGRVVNTTGLLAPQFAGAATIGNTTQGQLIDIFVRDFTFAPGGTPVAAEVTADFVTSLETDTNGLPVDYALPRTDGYFNGCLLTILDGPAKGESVRVIDYDYLGDDVLPPNDSGTLAGAINGLIDTFGNGEREVFRLRVMAIPRADGQPLVLATDGGQNDLAGHSFMVNGRPFNGSGVGLSLLSDPSGPRLTAVEQAALANGSSVGVEPALAPHARYFIEAYQLTQQQDRRALQAGSAALPDPMSGHTGNSFVALGELYQNFVGPGGADESYDAPDFQNMFLASNPLRPRPRGRVIDSNGVAREVADYYANNSGAPARLELDGLPIPSFHRPALANFWLHRLYTAPWLTDAVGNGVDRIRAILKPYDDTGAPVVAPAIAAQIAAFKRKYMLRPLVEDHPNFTGSNPFATFGDAELANIDSFVSGANITFPSFEVAGPWDVDNDGDGVPDSIWVDLGMPVQRTEDGRLYKPLFAIMVQDLDGRLNLNAHGSLEHMAVKQRDQSSRSRTARNSLINLAGGVSGDSLVVSSDMLPAGSGWGAADISLRSVLSPRLPLLDPSLMGSTFADDYARLFYGRQTPSPAGSQAAAYQVGETWGRYGAAEIAGVVPAQPGVPYNKPGVFNSMNPTLDRLAMLEKSDYPFYSPAVAAVKGYPTVSGFGTPPDLRSTFAVGLDYMGQPTHEAQYEAVYERATPGSVESLLFDSPYELDLMNHTRRDSVADVLDVTTGYAAGAPVDDDAPFAPGELERILRSLDADAGRLPDRLWNLVDAFDPAKLAVGTDAASTFTSTSSNTQNAVVTPGELLTAQIEAATRRRSVTTESFDIPSTNEDWTARLVVGADGLPGLPGVDDNNDGVVDGPGEAGLAPFNPTDANPDSDDYVAVMGEPVPAQARIIDYLRYRIVLELKLQYPNLFDPAWPASRPELVQAVNLILDGGAVSTDQIAAMRTGAGLNDEQRFASFGGLLAPEVMAGLKMDINRPFGDGADNNGNGVVDEPYEAGESWVDVDGSGSPGRNPIYLEQNGYAGFQGSSDRLPSQTLDSDPTTMHEFDYVYGKDVNGRGAFIDGAPIQPIHDDAQLARQLYARHLYCLALLLMDENYLMPFDKRDAQVLEYLDPEAGQNNSSQREPSMAWRIAQVLQNNPPLGYPGPGDTGDVQQDARRRAWRKLTCRRIAQWAINCADMRDPDAVCTPFEYDENPWDGWNVVDRTNNQIHPIDGEPNTDENLGQFRTISVADRWQNAPSPQEASAIDQTRGVVWGMERPELLLTETFATHDRRTEDLEGFFNEDKSPQPGEENELLAPSDPGATPDETLDQRLRPLGSLFVEIYNPNSPDLQSPAELSRAVAYNDLDGDGSNDAQIGIALDRLSAVQDGDGKYSPVWRMIVVEEDPRLRNDQRTFDNDDYSLYEGFGNTPSLSALASAVAQGTVRPLASDPDFPTFDPLKVPTYNADVNGNLTVAKRKHGAYIERAVYFTNGADETRAPEDRDPEDLRVRIPMRYAEFDLSVRPPRATPGLPDLRHNMNKWLLYPEGNKVVGGKLRVYDYHFPPVDLDGDGDYADYEPFAPILPGRYAVIGTAGYKYDNRWNSSRRTANNTPFKGRFITPFGRSFSSSQQLQGGFENQPVGRMRDDAHFQNTLKWTRRFDMMPNPNPELHQFAVMHNGGPESRIISENGNRYDRNVTNPPKDNGSDAANLDETVGDLQSEPWRDFSPLPPNEPDRKIQPVVAIPIDGLSISTPLDGYLVRMLSLDNYSAARWAPGAAYGEGAFFQDEQKGPLDVPLDTAEHLIKNVTTPNFRSVHLQRLADPTLPWNPVDTTHAQHDTNLPVNPYVTVDTESVDLTAFNGVEPNDPAVLNQNAPAAKPEGLVHMTMASLQRGTYEAAVAIPTQLPNANNPAAVAPSVARAIWRREPTRITSDISNGAGVSSLALGPGQFAYQYYDASGGLEPQPSQGFTNFMNLASNLVPGETGGPKREPMVLNVPIRHTLGFANGFFPAVRGGRNIATAYTPFYSSNARFDQDGDGSPETDTNNYHTIDVNGDGVPGDLIGAPWTGLAGSAVQDDNTYPWLAWNNRPYASAMELLQAPATSAGALGAQFSVFNGELNIVPNPYNGVVSDNASEAANNDAREVAQHGQFGHLLNLFSTSGAPARAFNTDGNNTSMLLPSGAANLHRLSSYLRVPSRFVATQTSVNPNVFSVNAVNYGAAAVSTPDDPRNGLLAPFNRVDQYREPGRVNLNTVTGVLELPNRAGERESWSPVYDGLMHRNRDANWISGGVLQALGHRGPAWRDVVRSRRGYQDAALIGQRNPLIDVSPMALHPQVPTFFGNPFREPDEGQLVPLDSLVHPGAEASILRSHPYSPFSARPLNGNWGIAGVDDNSDGVMDDPGEAGFGALADSALFDNEGLPTAYQTSLGVGRSQEPTRVPLFSAGTTATGLNSERNAALRYMPLTRMSSLATTRSGAFAIWITVGFFEVEPADPWVLSDGSPGLVQARFNGSRELYDRVYPDGYQLGKELGSDTGDTHRYRGFWIVDRTLPVAFRPGDDINLEKMILLRREIE